MTAASAAVLIEPIDREAITRTDLVIGAVFLDPRHNRRRLLSSVAAGLQLGPGLSLAALGVRFSHRSLDRVRGMPVGIPKKALPRA
jgi:hypothetical protein